MIHQYTLEELQKSHIYIGDSKEELHINSLAELIPYYPYLISSGFFDNVERTATIYLSSESYVDSQEKDTLIFYLKEVLKIYNRCRRKKTDFTLDEVLREFYWSHWDEEVYTELYSRVLLHGKNANIEDIHTKTGEHYRQELADEMIKNGMDPAGYGYERFMSDTVYNIKF
jgi:hypothetical protein